MLWNVGMSRNYENMEVGMLNGNACMWPNVCSIVMLNFMLYFGCGYCGICIGNEN